MTRIIYDISFKICDFINGRICASAINNTPNPLSTQGILSNEKMYGDDTKIGDRFINPKKEISKNFAM